MVTLKIKLIRGSKRLCYEVYKISKSLPKTEIFGLRSQVRRSAVSVVCNIIEGFARDDWLKTGKDLLKFIEISYGSLEETRFLMEFIEKEYELDTLIFQRDADKLGALLFSFIKTLRFRIKNNIKLASGIR